MVSIEPGSKETHLIPVCLRSSMISMAFSVVGRKENTADRMSSIESNPFRSGQSMTSRAWQSHPQASVQMVSTRSGNRPPTREDMGTFEGIGIEALLKREGGQQRERGR